MRARSIPSASPTPAGTAAGTPLGIEPTSPKSNPTQQTSIDTKPTEANQKMNFETNPGSNGGNPPPIDPPPSSGGGSGDFGGPRKTPNPENLREFNNTNFSQADRDSLLIARREAAEKLKNVEGSRTYRREIQRGGNAVATATCQIDGKSLSFKSISGERNIDGFSPGTSENRQLPTFVVGKNSRHADVEINILEDILKQTTPDSQGKVKMFVDRLSCRSCVKATREFLRLRPGIQLEIVTIED